MDYSNKQMSELYRNNYDSWKTNALKNFGFFPVFQPLKETFLLCNLSGNAIKLYIYLGLMSGNTTGETWVSIETVAKYFNKSPRAISGWFRELEKNNLIRRLQLKHNEVAHTFLLPYGEGHLSNENSIQKNK